jgi:hypothetical protein
MIPKNKPHLIAMVVGIIVTALMIFVFGFMLIGSIIEKGMDEIKEIAKACINWYDDPTGFFLSYLIGYIIVWWRPLWGSIIIISVSLLSVLINIGNPGFLMFTVPTCLVGILYLFAWYDNKKEKIKPTD